MRRDFLFVFLLSGILYPQTNEHQSVLEPFRYFVGSWEGSAKGRPGLGKVEREYEFIFHDKFLQVKGKTVYEPQDKNPEGEVHEEWGVFSYDLNRKKFVLRQINVEGIANQYVLDSLAFDENKIVFVSESIENFFDGWRARETYKILGQDEFVEVFELAPPGKDFRLFSESYLKRKK
jgi:hypothetical protein